MSGGVYCPGLELLHLDLASLELSDALNWNPLHCLLCQDSLFEPVALPCFHVFCRRCVISRREKDQRIKCPLCGSECDANDHALPTDRIVKYFIESANEKTDLCANCDQVKQPMFFCETCQQPLCPPCKDQTHQAKMFSTHRMVPHEERSGQATTKLCKLHSEPYILFSSDTKSLVCIMCFRKSNAETRPHFTDLDNAHRSGVDKLEKIAKQLKTFQKDVRDGIVLHRGLLDDVRKSANAESCQIQVLCQQMIDRLIEIRDQLLASINRECSEREEHFRRQLNVLCSLVPTIQLNLLIASIFCSSANKLDFLDLAYPLMHRIQAIVGEHQNITPSFTAQIQTSYKAEFARALEPFLGMKSVLLPTVSSSSLSRQLSSSAAVIGGGASGEPVFVTTSNSVNVGVASAVGGAGYGGGSGGELSPCGSVHSLQNSRAGSATNKRSSYAHFHRLKLMIDLAGAFGDEYNKIDSKLKELLKRFSNVSRSAQEVQRDMTLRRCLIDETRLTDVLTQCQRLKIDVGVHSTQVDDLQPIFQHIWEEELDRVRIQQETYKNHIAGVLNLREDLHRVITATEQLEPFVRSLAQVIQQMKPERCRLDDPGPMEKICLQITTLAPNSQSRVDAIERQEQQRRQEMERKKQEGTQILASVKRQLKTPVKDHCQKRRSTTEIYVESGGGASAEGQGAADPAAVVVGSPPSVPVLVVKEVERDRVECNQLSPGSKHKLTNATGGGVSPKPPYKKPSSSNSEAKLGGSSASLDESFELLLNTMEGNVGKQKPSTGKRTELEPEEETGKQGRSQTLSEGVAPKAADESGQSALAPMVTSSNSLPSLASSGIAESIEKNEPSDRTTEPSTMEIEAKDDSTSQEPKRDEIKPPAVPRAPKLPPNLIANVSPSTLEARERVLASLKEKVPRIDVGPACNNDGE